MTCYFVEQNVARTHSEPPSEDQPDHAAGTPTTAQSGVSGPPGTPVTGGDKPQPRGSSAAVTGSWRERIAAMRAAAHGGDDTHFDPNATGQPIPRPVRLAAGWAGRLIVIGLGIYLLLWLLDVLAVVVVPVVVSLLVAALLTPLTRLLRRIGLPKGITVGLSFLIGVGAFFGLITLIVREFIVNYQTIYDTVAAGLEQGIEWLSKGPLNIDQSSLQEGIDSALANLQGDPGEIVGTSLSVLSTTGSVLSGTLLTLLIILFFLIDGRTIWVWICKLFPRSARWKVYRAGNRSWEVLVTYMSVTLFVALIVGIATWAACLIAGVPLALTAGLVAFLFTFIPTLGALISSIAVVALTLVSTNLGTAIAMTIVMVAIQTIQGNFIYPLLMNRQLKVHPLASLLLVVLGAVVGGIFGALIAVPLAAVLNTAWLDLLRSSQGLPESPDPASLGPQSGDEDLRDPTLDDPTDAKVEADATRIETFGPEAPDDRSAR